MNVEGENGNFENMARYGTTQKPERGNLLQESGSQKTEFNALSTSLKSAQPKTPTRSAVKYPDEDKKHLRISEYHGAAQSLLSSRQGRKLSPDAIEKKRNQIHQYQKNDSKAEWQGIGSGVKVRTEDEYKAELERRRAERP